MNAKLQKIEEVLTRGVEKIYPSKNDLKKRLFKHKKIRLYQGFDPSMPNLHLGNYVGLMKLRQFQQLGHEVIFLVGDFTGMIGDPTDKLAARRKLTRKQVLTNAKNWKEQASRFLNFSGKNPAKIMFNSRWLDKITFKDLIETTAHFTVQQMIQRDFFQKRIKQEKPIHLHEFLYPIAQAIDCVKMDVDLEIGGSDQTFNMLAGRHLMAVSKNKEKFVLTTKLLTDKEGQKVGKTTGNALFLNASAEEMFGQIMAFSDETIILGLELLTEIRLKTIKALEKQLKQKAINPMVAKKQLAFAVVEINYGLARAQKAQKEFERVFKQKGLPSQIKEKRLKEKSLNIMDLLLKIGLVSSKTEAKRLILQKGVKINNQIQNDWKKQIVLKQEAIVQVGKRKFVKIK